MQIVTLSPARPDEMAVVRELFRAYQKSIGVDLCFQNFEMELRELPGDYAPPSGTIILARRDSLPVGCGAVRRLEEGICEMKRLYVLPDVRGTGIGRRMAEELIRFARQAGYSSMRLDTLPVMKEAIALYLSIGFREALPYRFNPHPGAIYMQRAL